VLEFNNRLPRYSSMSGLQETVHELNSSWNFPLFQVITLCTSLALICWIFSIVTLNYSHVDRLWSIVPVLYVIWFTVHAIWTDKEWNVRLALMSALTTIWGTRLTFNFWRKGGYILTEQDYRWEEIRKRFPNNFLWQIFNLLFIASYQNYLLLLISLPAYTAFVYRQTPLNVLDFCGSGLFLCFVLGETLADEQQWQFHQEKRKGNKIGEYGDGFLQSGLFSWSRHPNFFCEMMIWWSFYIFTISSSGQVMHWTVTGTVLLTLLFQGSARVTEHLSAKKYKKYSEYQNHVPMFFSLRLPKMKRK